MKQYMTNRGKEKPKGKREREGTTKLQSDQQFVAVAGPVAWPECRLYCTYCVCSACVTVGRSLEKVAGGEGGGGR